MATAKKTVAKKNAAKHFLLLRSSGVEFNQAVHAQDYGAKNSYPTKDAAMKAAPEVVSDMTDSGDGCGAIYVVEVVAIGKPSGVEWK